VTPLKYILLFSCILITSIAQIFLKYGSQIKLVSSVPTKTHSYIDLVNSYILIGIVLYGIAAIIWVFTLRIMPVSIAYPTMAVSYIIVAIAGVYLFNEHLSLPNITGLILIITGVTLLVAHTSK